MDLLGNGLGFSIAGLVVGTAVGATGVGGGSLMTPILILFYGISPALAVGTDLLYASISKSFGVLLHGRNGSLDWAIVGWLSVGSVPAALLTLVMLDQIGSSAELDRLIKLTLSAAVIVTALFTLCQELLASRLHMDQVRAELPPATQRALTVAAGVLIGTVVTISSVGAGVIGMMILLLLYPKHAPIRIVGSDLAHAVLITAIAGAGHARMGSVNYELLGWLLLGALPGIWIGSRLGFRMNPRSLKRAIAGILIVVGSMTLWKTLNAPTPAAAASQSSTVTH
ncbi:sulfite exporter TauE/SafE family protein [Nevskia sp.]|uniref:sulfite exporter TauE/SafE family protein n=1 Tax=Nevskia sp. TaxID=1929292 RepID=UPI0025F2D85B|nr:sulfite exporter TauE/SafE family protein [Nevskia sp.]